jgi:putative endopeptidase
VISAATELFEPHESIAGNFAKERTFGRRCATRSDLAGLRPNKLFQLVDSFFKFTTDVMPDPETLPGSHPPDGDVQVSPKEDVCPQELLKTERMKPRRQIVKLTNSSDRSSPGRPKALRRQVGLLSLSTLMVAAGGSLSASAFDVANIDIKSNPKTDFPKYAYGAWLDRTAIPADRPSFGAFDEVSVPLDEKLLSLVTKPQTSRDGRKMNALFQQAMDLEGRNASGLRPIQKDLNQIRKATSLRSLFRLGNGFGQFGYQILADVNNPTKVALALTSPGLGLGSRELYLLKDENTSRLQNQYQAFLADQLRLVGYPTLKAKREAKRVLALEKSIAQLSFAPEAVAADFAIANKPTAIASLQKMAPSIDWKSIATKANLAANETIIVTESDYLRSYEKLFRGEKLTTVKALYVSQLLISSGPYLSDDIGTLQFEFAKNITGQQEQRPLQQRSLNQVNALMGDTVGQLYAENYFTPSAKTEIEAITKEVLAAFRIRIQASAWLTPATKAKAIEKLGKVKPRVGYPDRFNTYENVTLGVSYAESFRNFANAKTLEDLATVNRPVDNSNWGPVAQVNAFYNPTDNTINFPAGILAGEFFNEKADPAANFGSIGAVVGHELTHGFDISGSQFDGDGRLTSWWTDEDRRSFEALNKRLVAQFGAIKVGDIGNVDGQLTVGENVADLGGVQVAFDALNARLAKSDPGMIDGLTQRQRFFLSWTQTWKDKSRPEYDRSLLVTDVHSPARVRAIQPLRNMAAFHETFAIKEGDPMWLAPAERVTVW